MTTSEERAYVYLQLPESLEVVTAGLYTLEVRSGVPRGTFAYNPSYIARRDAVPLEPFELPLRRQPAETVRSGGIFGCLRDASPDAWGRRLIERHLGRVDLSEVDYLLHSPEDRAGALSFGRGKVAPAPTRHFNRVVKLGALLRFADAMDPSQTAQSFALAVQLEELLQPGTSLGGARPKNVVEDDEGLWVAKFPAKGDRWNFARVEAATLALARECEIRTPRTRIVEVDGRDVLLVERFDRKRVPEGYLRHRMVSALTVLGADESATERDRWSYLLFADELRRRSRQPAKDLAELYRRIAFNALISNTDDHPRNHALIAPDRDWDLSPAYDLMPHPMTSLEKRDLAMTAGRFGTYGNRENLLSECARFLLRTEDAAAILDELSAIVATRWRGVFRTQGVSEVDCDLLAPSFVYPGFRLDPETVLGSRPQR
jgi:serine/threonine-protein kinase HipA